MGFESLRDKFAPELSAGQLAEARKAEKDDVAAETAERKLLQMTDAITSVSWRLPEQFACLQQGLALCYLARRSGLPLKLSVRSTSGWQPAQSACLGGRQRQRSRGSR